MEPKTGTITKEQNDRKIDFLELVRTLTKPNLEQAEKIAEFEKEINHPDFSNAILISI